MSSAAKRSKFFKWTSLARCIFWLILTPVAYYAHWLEAVKFVSVLSLLALVLTDFTAWRSDENPDTERIERIETKLDQLLGG